MSNDDEEGVVGKVFLTALVLVVSPFVELVTAAAPIGTLGAVVAIAAIWGLDFPDEVDGGS